MKKKYLLFIMFFYSHAWAIGNGLHFTFDFNRDQGETAAIGTGNYFYQNGEMLADVQMKLGAVDRLVMLQKGASLYTLFPQEKSYMEVPQIVRDAAKNRVQSDNDIAFVKTNQKKKIAGYDCEIFTRKTSKSSDTVCLNQSLHREYKDIFEKMKEMTGQDAWMGTTQGFPLEIKSVGIVDKKSTTVLVKSIEKGDFVSKLSIPKEYQEKNAISGGLEMLKKMTEHP